MATGREITALRHEDQVSSVAFSPDGRTLATGSWDWTARLWEIWEWACISSWLEPASDAVNIQWARDLSEVMRPFTTGSDYVNQIGLETDEGSERIRAAYGANYERLVAVKNKYDPTNLFRHNQNIRPTV